MSNGRHVSTIIVPIAYDLIGHLRSPFFLFPLNFPTKFLYAFFFSSVHYTCPSNLIVLDMITVAIPGEEHML
jgi:hypothetical protein